jgi:hypothetical protein
LYKITPNSNIFSIFAFIQQNNKKMIVEFSVANFRSIKEMQTISFAATKLDSSPYNAEVDKNNIVEEGGMRLLKTVGIYGANASGKSNVIKALDYFIELITKLPSPTSRLQKIYDPFLFQEAFETTESYFQIVFIADEKKYRYGFTIKGDKISNEWLYGTLNKNMVPYFIRSEKQNEPDIKDVFKEAKEVPPLELKHNLFLVHVASYKKAIASTILEYFLKKSVFGYRGLYTLRYITIELLRDKGVKFKENVLQLLSNFGLPYSDILIRTEQENSPISPIPLEKIGLIKNVTDQSGIAQTVELNLGVNESSGTQKLFDLAGTILFCLNTESLFVIDELDSNFHPSLVIKLIQLFNDTSINKAQSQILFTSHDTNLLDPSILRRDQIYFTEKSEHESTRLYSLADLKGIRNDADFARQYLAGFYGALPVLSTYTEKAVQDE